MQHLSSARLPHMHDLCRGCHSDKSDTRKTSEDPTLLVQGCSVQRETPVRVHRGNNSGPLERATPTEAFEKDKYHYAVCPPSSCYKMSCACACSAPCPIQRELSVQQVTPIGVRNLKLTGFRGELRKWRSQKNSMSHLAGLNSPPLKANDLEYQRSLLQGS